MTLRTHRETIAHFVFWSGFLACLGATTDLAPIGVGLAGLLTMVVGLPLMGPLAPPDGPTQ